MDTDVLAGFCPYVRCGKERGLDAKPIAGRYLGQPCGRGPRSDDTISGSDMMPIRLRQDIL